MATAGVSQFAGELSLCNVCPGAKRRTSVARTKSPDVLDDFDDPQASVRMVRGNGRARHTRYFGFIGVLHERHSAVFHNSPQPRGAVAIASTQHDTHDPRTVGFGGGNEQRIGGRPGVVAFRPLVQSDVISSQDHMMVRRCHVDVPGLDRCPVNSKHG